MFLFPREIEYNAKLQTLQKMAKYRMLKDFQLSYYMESYMEKGSDGWIPSDPHFYII